MKIQTLTVTALAVMIALPVFAGEMKSHSADHEFSQIDTDHDGYISREEAGKVNRLSGRFSKADRNNDGKLSASEFHNAREGKGDMRHDDMQGHDSMKGRGPTHDTGPMRNDRTHQGSMNDGTPNPYGSAENSTMGDRDNTSESGAAHDSSGG